MADKTILCPYCFEEFRTSEALYQCVNLEKDNDGEYCCPRETQEGYDRYWRGEDLPLRYTWPQKKKGFFARFGSSTLEASKCPQCGQLSERFVCPHCFNHLPIEMVQNGSEIISVVGSPSSGKTNYIITLIQQLRKFGSRLDLQVTPMQVYSDGHKDDATDIVYNKMREQLFDSGYVIEKTPEAKKDVPLIFHVYQQSTNRSIYLVFYDTAGEKFQENIKNNAKYLSRSSGVIVLLDCLSVPYIKEALRDKGFDELTGRPSMPLTEIQTALANAQQDRVDIYSKPFAFVFSKFDAVIDNKDALNDFPVQAFCKGDQYLDSSYKKTGKLDIDKINEINSTIELALDDEKTWDQTEFRLFAHNWTSQKNKKININSRDLDDSDNNYRFFGVSALGSMPVDSSVEGKVTPYRVMDPLIWMLYKLGKFNIPTTKDK